jgi:predicted P-loop ATPase/GTPase
MGRGLYIFIKISTAPNIVRISRSRRSMQFRYRSGTEKIGVPCATGSHFAARILHEKTILKWILKE